MAEQSQERDMERRIDFQALRDRRRTARHFLLLALFVGVGGTIALLLLSLLNP